MMDDGERIDELLHELRGACGEERSRTLGILCRALIRGGYRGEGFGYEDAVLDFEHSVSWMRAGVEVLKSRIEGMLRVLGDLEVETRSHVGDKLGDLATECRVVGRVLLRDRMEDPLPRDMGEGEAWDVRQRPLSFTLYLRGSQRYLPNGLHGGGILTQ